MTESLWMELLCDKHVCFCGFVSCVVTLDDYTSLRETHLEWHMCMYICHTHTHHQPLNYNIDTPSGFYAQSSDVKFYSNILKYICTWCSKW